MARLASGLWVLLASIVFALLSWSPTGRGDLIGTPLNFDALAIRHHDENVGTLCLLWKRRYLTCMLKYANTRCENA